MVGKKKKGEDDVEMDTDDEDQQILDTLTCLRLRGPCAVKKMEYRLLMNMPDILCGQILTKSSA